MSVQDTPPAGRSLLERLAPLGAVVFAVWLAIAFVMTEGGGDTAREVISNADEGETGNAVALILALVTPLLLGWFVAGLASGLTRARETMTRALTVIGGTLFIAFFTTAMIFWTAPLLDPDELTNAAAESYVAFDDVGWVLLGSAGISAGVMIIGYSLAALRLRWWPSWVAFVSILLGVVSLATVAFVGLFAWMLWFFAAGVALLAQEFRGAGTSAERGVVGPTA